MRMLEGRLVGVWQRCCIHIRRVSDASTTHLAGLHTSRQETPNAGQTSRQYWRICKSQLKMQAQKPLHLQGHLLCSTGACVSVRSCARLMADGARRQILPFLFHHFRSHEAGCAHKGVPFQVAMVVSLAAHCVTALQRSSSLHTPTTCFACCEPVERLLCLLLSQNQAPALPSVSHVCIDIACCESVEHLLCML